MNHEQDMLASAQDPVHQDESDGQWYFWDETWANRYGPYDSRRKAEQRIDDYCRDVLG